jgi:predicted RNase H-like nuclease (RuvC/YqgF family)
MFKIEFQSKGMREETLKRVLTDKFPEASISVRKYERPESRRERFNEALGLVSDAKDEIESLRDELQEWMDSIPENLQGGEKYSQLEEGVSNLEEIANNLDSAMGGDVEFPSMF